MSLAPSELNAISSIFEQMVVDYLWLKDINEIDGQTEEILWKLAEKRFYEGHD